MSLVARLLAVPALLLLAGCGSGGGSTQTASAPPAIEGVAWTSTAGPTITFQDGKASGSTGCNRFSAPYNSSGSELTFGPVATTQMACAGKAAETEQAFLHALAQVREAAVQGGELVLSDGSGNELIRFAKASPAGNWTVTAFLYKDAIRSPEPGTKITADFGKDGSLRGFGGCNNYHGRYTVDGSSVHISDVTATAKHCAEPKGVAEQELGYLHALEKTASFEVEGGKLTLLTAQHTIVANYERSG